VLAAASSLAPGQDPVSKRRPSSNMRAVAEEFPEGGNAVLPPLNVAHDAVAAATEQGPSFLCGRLYVAANLVAVKPFPSHPIYPSL
jgi:hypothetical protein